MKTTSLRVGQMGTNCYLLTDKKTEKTLIIDPGDDAEYIMDSLTKLGTDPLWIIATHGHFDHIMAARVLQLAYNIPCFLDESDEFLVDRMRETAQHFLKLREVDPPPVISAFAKPRLKVGSSTLDIIPLPGHTPGSICVYDPAGAQAFVGDTLFAGGSVGRTDFSYSDPNQLQKSIQRILALPPETTLYPGHGEPTRVRYEYDGAYR